MAEGESVPIDYQKIIDQTLTNGLGYLPEVPHRFGMPELIWRLGFMNFRLRRDKATMNAVGLIGSLIDHAIQEGLEGEMYFASRETFYPVLHRFTERVKELKQHDFESKGRYTPNRLLVREVLDPNHKSDIVPLPIVTFETADI